MQTIGGREPLHGDLGRFYDAIENPRKIRGELPILRDAELRSYLADVRERTLDVLDGVEIGPDVEDPLLRDGFVYEMLLAHELQHNETMLQLLQLVDGYELPAAVERTQFSPHTRGQVRPVQVEMVAIEAGEYEIGAPGRGFAYDNERPRHTVELAAFEIDRTPVTNGAYISFMEDTGAEPPLYWQRQEDRWLDSARGRREPIDTDAPVAPRLLGSGRRLRPLGRQAPADRVRVGVGPRAPRRPRPRLGMDLVVTSSPIPASRPSPTASTRRSSSATPTRSYAVAPGRPTHVSPGRASATGTCRSAARSSPASVARGTHDDRDRRPPRRRRGGEDGARRSRGPLRLSEGGGAEILLRRARLAAVRADHRAARVLPDAGRAGDPHNPLRRDPRRRRRAPRR